jgi:prefoldin beta subunit
LDLLEPDSVIYKQMGPALVKQDFEEAKQAVARRLEFINKEW